MRVRVLASDGNSGEPGATRDVGDPRTRRTQPVVQTGNGSQPLSCKKMTEDRCVLIGLPFDGIGPQIRPRNTIPGPERRKDTRQRRRAGDEQARQPGHRREALPVAEDFGVPGRERVPALLRGRMCVHDDQETGNGLLFEPLPNISFCGVRFPSELDARKGPGFLERAVVPQPVADVYRKGVERFEACVEQPL